MPWSSQSMPAEHKSSAPPGGVPAASKVPPPPTEVMVRTMESDIRSLAESGGRRTEGQMMNIGGESAGRTSSWHLATAVYLLGGVVVLAAAIYFSFFY